MKRNLGENPPECKEFSQKVLAVYHNGIEYDYKILVYLNSFPFGQVGKWFDQNFTVQDPPKTWYNLPHEFPFIDPDEICITAQAPKSITVAEAMGVDVEFHEREKLTEDEIAEIIEKIKTPAKLGGDEPEVIEIS